jgi:hypothetical protein
MKITNEQKTRIAIEMIKRIWNLRDELKKKRVPQAYKEYYLSEIVQARHIRNIMIKESNFLPNERRKFK